MTSSLLLPCSAAVALATWVSVSEAQTPDPITGRLVLGARSEWRLGGGEAHDHLLDLHASQFARIVVEQQGVDVVVRVIHPDGRQIQEVDSPNGTTGPEPVAMLSDTAGDYRISVVALDSTAPPGQYAITLTELRAAIPSDARRLETEGQYARGTQAKLGGTAAAFKEALGHLDSAATGWRAVGDSAQLAVTLVEIGDARKRLGDDDPAIAVLDSALSIYRNLRDVSGEISALNQLGMVYGNKEEDSLAIARFEAAILLAQQAGDRAMEASATTNVGNQYYASGRMDEARAALERAVSIARELGDPSREAPALNNLARFLDIVGEYGTALIQYRRALELTRAIPDLAGEMAVLSNMGSAYSSLGANERAVTARLDALKIARKLGDLRSQAIILNNLAVSHGYLHRPDSALANYREAVRIARETHLRSVEAQATEGIGTVLRDQRHDATGAIVEFANALTLWRQLNDRMGEARTTGELGQAYADLGDRARAWEVLRQALEMMRQTRQRVYAVKTLRRMADLAEAEGDLDSALAIRREGAAAFEALRNNTMAGSLRTAYTATAQSSTQDYIGLLMRLHDRNPMAGHDREAFEVAEQSRARTLLDDLSAANVNYREGTDTGLVAAERATAGRIDSLASRLGRGRAPQDADSAQTLRLALERALADADDLRDRLRAANPHYAALTEKALDLPAIQQFLDSSTALLAYAGGDAQGYGWLVTSESLTSFALPSDSVLTALGRRYLSLVSERSLRIEGESIAAWRARMSRARRELPMVAGQLSAAVFGPVATRLDQRRLLIMPSGVLQFVPLEALPTPRGAARAGEAMIARGEIVIIPSASTIAVMRALRLRRERPPRTLAVLADPVFSPDDSRLARPGAAERLPTKPPQADSGEGLALRAAGVEEGSALPRLSASREEARAILALVPAGQRLEALGLRANRALALGDVLGQYRIVHFATHGFVNTDYPELSGVALSTVDERGEATDGFLRVHQIYSLHLPVDLVVLSACQTALGRAVKGEGLIGLSRAFMYAGASAVVASLWKVDDRATAEMMTRFYRGMLGPARLRPAAALRAAQLEMSRSSRWSDAYYWAAFTIQGDWQ